MPRVLRTRATGRDAVWFECPGCNLVHLTPIDRNDGGVRPAWTFNGDLERPTLSPSILRSGGVRCHSFVQAGSIRFLDDCDHELAGQTVELPEIDAAVDMETAIVSHLRDEDGDQT